MTKTKYTRLSVLKAVPIKIVAREWLMVQVSLLPSSSVLHMTQNVPPKYRHLSDRIYKSTFHKTVSYHKNLMILLQKLNCLCLYGYGFLAVHLCISGALLANADHWTPYPVLLILLVKICQFFLKKGSAVGRSFPKQDTTKKWMRPISFSQMEIRTQ